MCALSLQCYVICGKCRPAQCITPSAGRRVAECSDDKVSLRSYTMYLMESRTPDLPWHDLFQKSSFI